jgi:RNA polymerase sigma factor for flagellar operon FliA
MNALSPQHQFAPDVSGALAGYGQHAEMLVRQHKALVRRIAWQLHGRAASDGQLEDLVQVGLMALVEASRTYQDRGHSFITYATTCIRGRMIDHLRREMMTTRSSGQVRRQINEAKDRLYQKLGRGASSSEVAQELGVGEREFFDLEQQAVSGQRMSIDDMDENLIGMFQGLDPSAADTLEMSDLVNMLQQEIQRLPQREQLVLQLYFFEELNLHEIGEVLSVSAARACQIKASALAQLEKSMKQLTHV